MMSRIDTFSPGSDLFSSNHKPNGTRLKFLGDTFTPRKMENDISTQGLRERANRVMSVEKQKNELIEVCRYAMSILIAKHKLTNMRI